jgi:hypothetical protein
MFNMKNLIVLSMIIGLSVSTVFAGPFKANANTKRIPAGTRFQLEFLQEVDTYAGGIGDSFTAMLKNEQANESGVILPAGSIVRGSIGNLKTAKRFSRGAKLYLDFDHVVTPSGRQIPLDMAVCRFDKIYYDGGLYKNLGYGEAVKNNLNTAVDITKRATGYGLDVQDTHPGLQYLTTPLCAVGGFIGGVGYFVGDSVIDMFRMGQEVKINPGDIIEVQLLNPIDVPVY